MGVLIVFYVSSDPNNGFFAQIAIHEAGFASDGFSGFELSTRLFSEIDMMAGYYRPLLFSYH